jgi:hypothetical protein
LRLYAGVSIRHRGSNERHLLLRSSSHVLAASDRSISMEGSLLPPERRLRTAVTVAGIILGADKGRVPTIF